MIGFRLDYNSFVGTGHMFRCLSIASSIIKKGGDVCFVLSNDSSPSYIIQLGIPYHIVSNSRYNNWSIEDEKEMLSLYNITTLIVDSYTVDKKMISSLHECCKLIYIDDYVRDDFDVDIIINYNIEVRPYHYSLDKNGRKVYTGISFFPLRDSLKPLPHKIIQNKVNNVLITTGGTDPLCCIDKILGALEVNNYPSITFKIILGLFFEKNYVDCLKNKYFGYNNVEFLEWGQDMRALYEETDIVISPGSTTVYEALSFGVPCLTFEFTENQHNECIALENMGIARYIGDYNLDESQLINSQLCMLFDSELDYKTRKKQNEFFSMLFDGNGSDRVADIIINYENEKSL